MSRDQARNSPNREHNPPRRPTKDRPHPTRQATNHTDVPRWGADNRRLLASQIPPPLVVLDKAHMFPHAASVSRPKPDEPWEAFALRLPLSAAASLRAVAAREGQTPARLARSWMVALLALDAAQGGTGIDASLGDSGSENLVKAADIDTDPRIAAFYNHPVDTRQPVNSA